MLVAGPLLTFLSISSCFATILSGNIFACVNDVAYVAFGGLIFVVGIVITVIGLAMPDPPHAIAPAYPIAMAPSAGPYSLQQLPSSMTVSSSSMPQQAVACKKCGKTIEAGQFFCLNCGQSRS